MITLKRQFTVQSQKLVIAYTRPQVSIVSSFINDNYKIKQSTTMLSIGAKNMGLYLADIFQGRIEYELIYSLRVAKHRVDYSSHIR